VRSVLKEQFRQEVETVGNHRGGIAGMTIGWQEQLRPGVALKGIVQQATAALIAMDAERLEELALCCADLNREWDKSGACGRAVSDLRGVESDRNLLKAILSETRANLTVLSRLHTIRLREALYLESRQSLSRAAEEAEAFGMWMHQERTPDYGDN
jgi:hypothetical protein